MQGRCEKHNFELAEDRCGTCGQEYCAECLVYSFGPKRPPFCIRCAVAAAGVRTAGAPAPIPRKELRQIERARRVAFKAARKEAKAAARNGSDLPVVEPAPEPALFSPMPAVTLPEPLHPIAATG